MGRMDRVREELQATVSKLSSSIEKSHSEGKIPADYSLGFANGVIFFEHMLSQREGGPKFFDRTTSIGALPIPIALRAPAEVEKEYNATAAAAKAQEERYYESNIIAQARGMIETMDAIKEFEDKNPDGENRELVVSFSKGLAAVRNAISELDEMLYKREEAAHAQHVHAQAQEGPGAITDQEPPPITTDFQGATPIKP